MRRWTALWKKEVAAYFRAPAHYVLMAAFSAVAGLGFWRLAVQSEEAPLPLSLMLFGPIFFWLVALAIIAAITMRLFAEEKKSGTIETLLTAPVRDGEIVLAKYAAALAFFVFLCAPTVLLIPLLRWVSGGVAAVDWGPIVGGYLILLAAGAFYIAIGLLVSALMRSPAIAGALCFCILCFLFFLDYFHYVLPAGLARQMLASVASTEHVMEFSAGVVDTRPLVLYVTGAAWLLFVATRVVDSERWR